MQGEQLLRKILRDHSHKTTQPRLRVFRALLKSSPVSMNELVVALGGNVDRVSVYRIVALFERLGIVKRIAIGWKYRLELGDIFSTHHHHVTCLRCGKIATIHEDAATERLIERLGQDNGFSVIAHQLELQGYCETCQVAEAAAPSEAG